MKCIYHKTDLDGLCSGAIVKNKYPECEMIGMDYCDEFNEQVGDGETIFIVDFSLPVEQMELLNNKCDLIWIDHHEGIINDVNKYSRLSNIHGLRYVGKGACELTWEYLNQDNLSKGKLLPIGIWLLSRYDVWDLGVDDNILPYQYALRGLIKSPEDEIWGEVFTYSSECVKRFVDRGKIILDHIKIENEKFISIAAFEIEFDRKRAIVCNKGVIGSQLFDSIWDENKYDLMISFYRAKNGKWIVSIYTTKRNIDCSEIAKKYGGGGHLGAAGFTCDKLPF